jgi:hypothetical protein
LPLKNPGKKIRSWYKKKTRLAFNISQTKFFVKFSDITRAVLPVGSVLSHRISMWNITGLTNRIKTFVFKFYNNLLGLNTRLSHFVINQSRGCTFCNGTVNPVPDETFLHLFFDCPTTSSWQDKFLEKFITLPANLTREQRLQLFFFGILPNGTKDNLFLAFAIILFQFCIWEEKLRKKKPSFHTIENAYLDSLRSLVHCNKKVRESAELINISLCRFVGAVYNQPVHPRIPVPADQQRRQPP